MATMGMGVAGSYVGYLLQRAFLGEDQRRARLAAAHTRAGHRMRRELQALRGPAMKLGQTLSLQTGVLPEEALLELSALQREAPAMHPSLMRTQFRASLGRDPESVYATFEDHPFAAASLGQVHRATLRDGTPVAVKIQYPGIRDAIASDFAWFRAVSKPAQATGHLPGGAIDELEEQIVAEADYAREADNVDLFRRGMALPFVNVPKVFRQFSSRTVLTMSFLPGEHMDDFLARHPSRALRDLVGERLVELFYFQLLRLHALHADPHWGNYLFEADGTIGLVDFGCVKHLRPAFVEDLQAFLLFPGSRRSPQFQAMLARRYELMGGRINPAVRRTLTEFAEQFYRRVFPPDPEREHDRFDFGDRAFLQDYLHASRALVKSRGILPEYLFLARAEMGLYQTLHRLRARVATSHIVRRHLKGTAQQTGGAFIGTSR
jgi:predicted unusual protein kinase regulating ubiquinone biosynthesis (AarF/ABC1/UbiB family)